MERFDAWLEVHGAFADADRTVAAFETHTGRYFSPDEWDRLRDWCWGPEDVSEGEG